MICAMQARTANKFSVLVSGSRDSLKAGNWVQTENTRPTCQMRNQCFVLLFRRSRFTSYCRVVGESGHVNGALGSSGFDSSRRPAPRKYEGLSVKWKSNCQGLKLRLRAPCPTPTPDLTTSKKHPQEDALSLP